MTKLIFKSFKALESFEIWKRAKFCWGAASVPLQIARHINVCFFLIWEIIFVIIITELEKFKLN